MSIYRTPSGRDVITRWCSERLDGWDVPHRRKVVTVRGADTHLVEAGVGRHCVLVLPGTNSAAASSLGLLRALVSRSRVVAADLPGQPGLSGDVQVRRAARLEWYGDWLCDLIETIADRPLTVLGHSLGAAIALSCRSPVPVRQVLVSPGGLVRLRLTPAVVGASLIWLVRRNALASRRLLRLMHAPGNEPRPELVDWMTLVARHVRTTTAPGLARVARSDLARTVFVGASDVFLPGATLAPATRRVLGVEPIVLAGAGHFVTEERADRIADLVSGAR